MKNKALSVLIIITLGITSCSDDDVQDNFDRGPILSNLSDNIIIPGYMDLEEKTTLLAVAATTFSNGVSLENLNTLRNSWKSARLGWKSIESFNFGPIDEKFLYTRMDIFPVSISSIEESISEYDGSDNYLVGVGSTSRGFGAIEYLLFYGSDENVLSSFADDKREAYLKLLIDDLNKNVNTVLSEWQLTYGEEFKLNTGNDVSASITQLVNAMVQHIEVIKNFKVETPLGLRTGSDPIPDLVESPFANTSSQLISANMDAIEIAFKGGNGIGLDDYLNELAITDEDGNNLTDEISTTIDECRTLANEIENLSEAVSSGDSKVNQLLVKLQELTTLMKSDMVSQLGLILTFSSNDGDS